MSMKKGDRVRQTHSYDGRLFLTEGMVLFVSPGSEHYSGSASVTFSKYRCMQDNGSLDEGNELSWNIPVKYLELAVIDDGVDNWV